MWWLSKATPSPASVELLPTSTSWSTLFVSALWLERIWIIRQIVSGHLTTFYGLFCPALNSIKAILTKDGDGIREYLTYWTVFTVFLCVEYIVNLLDPRTVAKYPPEVKLLFVLWLTLPQFQGAYRIYVLILRPYFDRYETDIDQGINDISAKVQHKAQLQARAILWQLFLAPNDGILSMSMSFASKSFLSVTNLNGVSLSKVDETLADMISQPTTKDAEKASSMLGTSHLGQRLLNDFSQLLTEGIYAYAGTLSSTHAHLTRCKCYLSMEGHKICLIPVKECVDEELRMSSSSSSSSSTSASVSTLPSSPTRIGMSSPSAHPTSAPTSSTRSIIIGILKVINVCTDIDDGRIVIISMIKASSPSLESQSLGNSLWRDHEDLKSLTSEQYHDSITNVYIRTGTEEEGEALMAGLQLIVSDLRNKVMNRDYN